MRESRAVGQAVWTGSIAFGLVNIPVKLYPATQPKDVRFHLYDRRTGKRVRYERVIRDEDLPTFEPEIAALPPSAASRPAEAAPPRGRADARERRREAVPAPAARHERGKDGRHRPLRPAHEASSRRDPRFERRARAGDAVLRRRGARRGRARAGTRGSRGERTRGEDGAAA